MKNQINEDRPPRGMWRRALWYADRTPEARNRYVDFLRALSILADSYAQMLLGRFLQGLGAAGPRIVSIAVVRDRYRGREMARVMSFIMTVFILVPVFALGNPFEETFYRAMVLLVVATRLSSA